jgi:hypothetical protein
VVARVDIAMRTVALAVALVLVRALAVSSVVFDAKACTRLVLAFGDAMMLMRSSVPNSLSLALECPMADCRASSRWDEQ